MQMQVRTAPRAANDQESRETEDQEKGIHASYFLLRVMQPRLCLCSGALSKRAEIYPGARLLSRLAPGSIACVSRYSIADTISLAYGLHVKPVLVAGEGLQDDRVSNYSQLASRASLPPSNQTSHTRALSTPLHCALLRLPGCIIDVGISANLGFQGGRLCRENRVRFKVRGSRGIASG